MQPLIVSVLLLWCSVVKYLQHLCNHYSSCFPRSDASSWVRFLLHPARGLQTFAGPQRPHSPPCCSSSSPRSRVEQICSNPGIVRAKSHIKFALYEPFDWAAAGIPPLGHSSVYMVWTHIWNKAGQSRIILRKLHTFQVTAYVIPVLCSLALGFRFFGGRLWALQDFSLHMSCFALH